MILVNETAAAGASNTDYRLPKERYELSMSNAIVVPAAQPVNPEPTCLFCGAVKLADGKLFCNDTCNFNYQYELALTLGGARFGSECRHEHTRHGRCTRCCRKVVRA